MIDRIRTLTDVFGIEVCAYAIMSNHYHLVLYVNEVALNDCFDADICERWGKIYSISPIELSWQKKELYTDYQKEMALSMIAKWRKRLSSISWFMPCSGTVIK